MTRKHLVWDLPTRLFHWGLVICLVALWLTAEVFDNAIEWHSYLGYTTLGLVLFRLMWGWLGTRYARFSSFLRSPRQTLAYARALMAGKPPATTGHNPLGGWLVPVVLLLVGSQAISGLFMSDDILFSGPYASTATGAVADVLTWLHHNLFNVVMALAALHIAAIVWYRLKLKRDLVGAMLHGKKAVPEGDGIPHSRLVVAVILAIAIATLLYWLVVIAAPEPEMFY